MTKRISMALCVVSLLVFAVVSPPVSAESNGLSKQAREAASIDELRASDAQLTQAIATLDKEVGSQTASVASAQQAVEAAQKKIEVTERSLVDTQGRIDGLLGAARDRAVKEYIRPRDDLVSRMFSAEGFDEASRRSELLAEFAGRDYEALEELRAARDDLEHQRRAAVDAQKIANERRVDAQKKLDLLNAARADKAKLEASLQERIKAYAGEDDAAAAFSSTIGNGDRASRGANSAADNSRVSGAGMRWPVPDHRVSSPFGTRWGRLHAGVDIEAKQNTPISAAKGGSVTFASWESGYGNYTCVDHGGGLVSCYAHQTRILVRVGQVVEQGELIGYSGNTGSSAGAHLHFETRVNGQPRDPMQYLP